MAKYDVTYKCGHTEEIVLYGKQDERKPQKTPIVGIGSTIGTKSTGCSKEERNVEQRG